MEKFILIIVMSLSAGLAHGGRGADELGRKFESVGQKLLLTAEQRVVWDKAAEGLRRLPSLIEGTRDRMNGCKRKVQAQTWDKANAQFFTCLYGELNPTIKEHKLMLEGWVAAYGAMNGEQRAEFDRHMLPVMNRMLGNMTRKNFKLLELADWKERHRSLVDGYVLRKEQRLDSLKRGNFPAAVEIVLSQYQDWHDTIDALNELNRSDYSALDASNKGNWDRDTASMFGH